MNPSPSYYLVFFPPKGKAMQKKVEQPTFASLAQNDVLKEVELAGIPHIITERRTFNIHNSTAANFFLIMDVILKPEA